MLLLYTQDLLSHLHQGLKYIGDTYTYECIKIYIMRYYFRQVTR